MFSTPVDIQAYIYTLMSIKIQSINNSVVFSTPVDINTQIRTTTENNEHKPLYFNIKIQATNIV